MFGRLFSRQSPATDEPDFQVTRAFSSEGVTYSLQGLSAAEWLAMPYLYEKHAELGALLAQLFEEGYALRDTERVRLEWGDVYRLMDDVAYQDSLRLLDLPPVATIRPALSNKGSLADQDFSIVVSGWVDDAGATITPPPKLTGAVATLNGNAFMLPATAWRVLGDIARFHQRPVEERTPDNNRREWGRIRHDALGAHAKFSDFLTKTIVLTPEKLRLGLHKSGEDEAKTVEVSPDFEEAPGRWLEMFDRFPEVLERYDIPDGEELVQVVIAPEVKTVLAEIKRMPGRRVSGARAEAFVRNPYALLGPDAASVIDAEAFEAERERAELTFQRFTPSIHRDAQGKLKRVSLLIEESQQDEVKGAEHVFASPDALARFNEKLAGRIARESQCCVWEGFELEILGETAQHLEQLRQVLAEWTAPQKVGMAEVFDLSRYSERIEGIGKESKYATPFIAREKEGEGWFPDNVVFGLQFLTPEGGQPITVAMDTGRVEELAKLVQDARDSGQEEVIFPGCPQPLPLDEAEGMVGAFMKALGEIKAGKFKPEAQEKPKPVERQHLVLKANIDAVEYEEQRAQLLGLAPGASPRLPSTLKPEIGLKEHQLYGVGWLQHLWRLSPNHCRGALLGDDMGLGKTIQLLTFIAEALEVEPDLEPVLIVAPVALLENWKEEIDKFFLPGALPALTLYGASLAEKRLPKGQLDQELAAQGITRLLRKDWLGDARVVLTTYETLRDLEFSLAAQHWSIMVCDEAQKIKNPNAMVTRAAKKQNVRFRVACTGTPVENTLTDLWCLFDFIQPGLLGALSQFGRRYRKPIEAETEEEKERVEELRGIIRPQLLRREKKDVARDLPEKIVTASCRNLPISDRQRALYGQAISAFRRTASGNGSAHLGVLQYLRRLCSDPMVEDQYQADRASVSQIIEDSPKMAWLMQGLAEIQQRSEKAIVFCEFRDLQRTLQRCIATYFKFHADIINGDTSAAADHAESRQKRIKAFQGKPGFGVIILSPLAVGFGVNIQAANHVIHFTRTWNPAKEDQATDRAYRIGQQKDVYVYYPVVVAHDFTTFDAKLDQLLDWKRGLSADMLNGTGELSMTEFLDLQNVDGSNAFA